MIEQHAGGVPARFWMCFAQIVQLSLRASDIMLPFIFFPFWFFFEYKNFILASYHFMYVPFFRLPLIFTITTMSVYNVQCLEMLYSGPALFPVPFAVRLQYYARNFLISLNNF